MSFSATVPVGSLARSNATLEPLFGPDNFSVPVYDGPRPAFATLHAWTDAAFEAAVRAIPGVQVSDIEGTPQDRVDAAISATSATASFGGNAQPLEGQASPGLHRDAGGALWWVIQAYDTNTWPDPLAVPALVRKARIPGEITEWVQPRDQFDAYLLEDPFTGQPERVTHNGKYWRTLVDSNVWEPGTDATLWEETDAEGNPVTTPAPTLPDPWVSGGGTLAAGSYDVDVLVTHDNPNDGGAIWVYRSTYAGNITEPGRDGTFDRFWEPISIASEYTP